jgi:prepilin-type N-terminal cleavage/methylation domain-containing protein
MKRIFRLQLTFLQNCAKVILDSLVRNMTLLILRSSVIRRRSKMRGFTLIEILLGLTIFAVIGLSLYTTFANGIQLSRQSEQLENLYREARWTYDILAADLENMVSYQFPIDKGDTHRVIVREATSRNVTVLSGELSGSQFGDEGYQQGSFWGDKTSLSFIIPTEHGLRTVRYYLSDVSEDEIFKTEVGETFSQNVDIELQNVSEKRVHSLIREEGPFVGFENLDDSSGRQKEILSRRVLEGSLNFSYAKFSGEQGGEDSELIRWFDFWNEQNLPLGVQAELMFANPNDPEQPLTVSKNIMVPIIAWGTKRY